MCLCFGLKIYCLVKCLLFTAVLYFPVKTTNACDCWLRANNDPISRSVRCFKNLTHHNNAEHLPCQQIEDLVRVGPLPNRNDTDSSNNHSHANTSIVFEPWAFAELVQDTSISQLQLDLHSTKLPVNALTLAGLEKIKHFLARTSVINWDGCSFANLHNLKQVLLNCKSIFNDFLTFGQSLETIHFVQCESVPLQFYCTICDQDPTIKVIRIRPGPPMINYMVKFTNFSESNTHSTSSIDSIMLEHLVVGKCLPSICSDSMLCRNNIPLKNALANIGKPELVIPVTTQQIALPVNDTALPLTSIPPKQIIKIARPVLPRHMRPLLQRYSFWVVLIVITSVAILLVAFCILIVLTQRRIGNHKTRLRSSAGLQASKPTTNGHAGNHCLDVERETALELPDII